MALTSTRPSADLAAYNVGDKVRIKGKDIRRYPGLWQSPNMDLTIEKIGTIKEIGSHCDRITYTVEFEDEYCTWAYGETEIKREEIYFSVSFSTPVVNFSDIIKNNIANVIEVGSFIKV